MLLVFFYMWTKHGANNAFRLSATSLEGMNPISSPEILTNLIEQLGQRKRRPHAFYKKTGLSLCFQIYNIICYVIFTMDGSLISENIMGNVRTVTFFFWFVFNGSATWKML